VYGAEAVLPTDIMHDAPRLVLYTEEEAKEVREDDVDLLEEAREQTLSRLQYTSRTSDAIMRRR
jgi:hypothetical protein